VHYLETLDLVLNYCLRANANFRFLEASYLVNRRKISLVGYRILLIFSIMVYDGLQVAFV
jgi:hypothetical protein